MSEHLDNIITAIEMELGEGKVAIAAAPKNGGWTESTRDPRGQFNGYVVLYPGQGLFEGSLAQGDELINESIQIKCVGKTAEQALAIRDRVRSALRGLRASTRSSALRLSVSRPVFRDDATSPSVFYVDDIYDLFIA